MCTIDVPHTNTKENYDMDILKRVAELTTERAKIVGRIANIDAMVKEKTARWKERKKEIDEEVHTLRLESGQKNIKLNEGTWYEKVGDTFTVTHKQEFLDWLIEREKTAGDAVNFLEAKVSAKAMKALVEENGDVPSWCKYNSIILTQFRKA